MWLGMTARMTNTGPIWNLVDGTDATYLNFSKSVLVIYQYVCIHCGATKQNQSLWWCTVKVCNLHHDVMVQIARFHSKLGTLKPLVLVGSLSYILTLALHSNFCVYIHDI